MHPQLAMKKSRHADVNIALRMGVEEEILAEQATSLFVPKKDEIIKAQGIHSQLRAASQELMTISQNKNW